PAFTAERRERGEFRAVGIQDGATAGLEQVAKQALLGGTVRGHVAMIVEVIARQVREGGSRDLDAVETVWRGAGARCLDGCEVGPLRTQFGEVAMQRDRVGGCQRAGAAP